MGENGGAILCARIIPLSVQGGGVMDAEKDFQDFRISDDAGIKGNLYHLGMSRGSTADGFISWIGTTTAHVSGFHRLDTLHLIEYRFQAPEATATQGGEFFSCLLYTSDAADDLLCVDLGGRRIIK